jgi:DNA-binding response OmpR family regulator
MQTDHTTTVDITLTIRVSTKSTHANGVAARLANALRTAFDPTDLVVHSPEIEVPQQRAVQREPALRILADSRRVLHRGEAVELTRLEFDLLLHLCAQPKRVHGRAVLMDQVWGAHTAVDTRTVDVHVRRIRRKLGDGAAIIGTVRGVGYRVDNAHLVRIEREAL